MEPSSTTNPNAIDPQLGKLREERVMTGLFPLQAVQIFQNKSHT